MKILEFLEFVGATTKGTETSSWDKHELSACILIPGYTVQLK